MTSARQKLIDLIDEPDVYARPAAEIDPLRLEAANALFQERRTQIPLVAKRAEDAGIDAISSFADLVPLLFAHTVYKSYPPSFVEKGRWDRMLQWLNTLSVADTTNVDVEGVSNVDDWLERLEKSGHHILATSGTSGKCSFLNHAPHDYDAKVRHWANTIGWPYVRPDGGRVYFSLGPHIGPNSAIEAALINSKLWAGNNEAYFLTDEPLLISEVSEAASLRKRMSEGTASPSEIAAFEEKAKAKGERMMQAVRDMADQILDRRHEPIVLSGMWGQHMLIIERARERGIPDGDFHKDSYIAAGGGVKNITLPTDYKEQVDRFYGDVIRNTCYGMTELASVMPRCEKMRYHFPPTIIPLILDQAGERLLGAEDGVDGVVEGRFGFLDLLLDGRWGGLITGDKVQVDMSDECPCGRPGPTILDTITRYAQSGEDDHIGCAGTIDSYIRGSLAAA